MASKLIDMEERDKEEAVVRLVFVDLAAAPNLFVL